MRKKIFPILSILISIIVCFVFVSFIDKEWNISNAAAGATGSKKIIESVQLKPDFVNSFDPEGDHGSNNYVITTNDGLRRHYQYSQERVRTYNQSNYYWTDMFNKFNYQSKGQSNDYSSKFYTKNVHLLDYTGIVNRDRKPYGMF